MLSKTAAVTASVLLLTMAAADSAPVQTGLNASSNATDTHRALSPQAGTCGSAVLDIDLLHNDMGSASLYGHGQCLYLCRSKPNCYGVTWTDFNGGTCWFKSSNSGVGAYRAGAISYLLTDGCKPGGIMMPQCDMVGHDQRSVRGARYQDCIGQCDMNDGCRGFTWSDFNGGTCWLKTLVAPCVFASNSYSFGVAWGKFQ